MKFIKPGLTVLLLLTLLSSCKKDDFLYTGKVKVTYTNHPTDLNVYFSPAENPQLAITNWLKPDKNGTLEYDLNIGNYILTSSSTTFFGPVGFQIRAGKTTVINFDSSNAGNVQ
jgi:hypothetical protein